MTPVITTIEPEAVYVRQLESRFRSVAGAVDLLEMFKRLPPEQVRQYIEASRAVRARIRKQ